MSQTIGIELNPATARVVTIRGLRSVPARWLELPWSPDRPAELVGALRAELGSAGRIGLSVGLGFLHLKQVRLPPLPAAERRRIMALDPERFFPVLGGPLALALVDEASFAFAADAAMLESWLEAFEAWGPVDTIQPSPLSLLAGMGRSVASGTFALPAGPGEGGLVVVGGGRFKLARRMSAVAGVPEAHPPPMRRGLPGEFLIALGAAKSVDGAVDEMLTTDRFAARLGKRRVRGVARAAAACLVFLALAGWAVNRSRDATLERVRDELAVVGPTARVALEQQRRLAELEREATAVDGPGGAQSQMLRVFAALGQRLPADATVLSAQASGQEWQIEGTAADAAAIVPILEADELFEEVRFLSATGRFREADRTYETFSIAFRAKS